MVKRSIPTLMGTAAYGFDPGLRHGAIVYAKFALGPREHHLEDFEVVFQWTKKFEPHLGKDSTTTDIAAFVHQYLVPHFSSRPAVIAGVEWDPQSVYWRAQKSQIVTMSFLLGYWMRALQTIGLPQAFITPKRLRSAFGITASEKAYVNDKIQMVDHPVLQLHDHSIPLDAKSDVFDAFLIAYLSAIISLRSSHGTG